MDWTKKKLIVKIVAWLEEKRLVDREGYHCLRDWLLAVNVTGEPTPIIHWEDGTSNSCSWKWIATSVLPVTKDIRPSGTGESPLQFDRLVGSDAKLEVKGRRETNTMPQWGWFKLAITSKQVLTRTILRSGRWGPQTMVASRYLRGWCRACCTTCSYARFWHKFLLWPRCCSD